MPPRPRRRTSWYGTERCVHRLIVRGRAATVYSDILDGGSGRAALPARRRRRAGSRPRVPARRARGRSSAPHRGVDLVLSDDRVSARHARVRARRARASWCATSARRTAPGTRARAISRGHGPGGLDAARRPLGAADRARGAAARRAAEPGAPVRRARRREPRDARGVRGARARRRVRRDACSSRARPAPARSSSRARSTTRRARRRGPFVAVDCGALPEGLLESELFGHVRGAFTGAAHARTGMLVRADGGTLFLDELGRVSPSVQARLLRVLEERVVRPLGGDSERAVDVRVIAASRDDLDAEVAAGRFRADLLYRLAVVRVRAAAAAHAPRGPAAPRARAAAPPRPRRRDAGRPGPRSPGRPRLARQRARAAQRARPRDRARARRAAVRRSRDPRRAPARSPATPGSRVRSDLPYADAKAAVLHDFERRYLADLLARTDGNLVRRVARARASIASTCARSRASTASSTAATTTTDRVVAFISSSSIATSIRGCGTRWSTSRSAPALPRPASSCFPFRVDDDGRRASSGGRPGDRGLPNGGARDVPVQCPVPRSPDPWPRETVSRPSPRRTRKVRPR